MKRPFFPIVGDDEPILVPSPQMRLYEESDLISNIKGPYQEKDYGWQEEVSLIKRDEQTVRDIPEDLLPPLFGQSRALIPGGNACRKRFVQLLLSPSRLSRRPRVSWLGSRPERI